MDQVKNIILVLSGKGGVGKSTVSVQIATALSKKGSSVGLLDVDLCGPSIPKMLGIENSVVHQCDEGWLPVEIEGLNKLSVMSIAFLLDSPDKPVIWRGPKKSSMIKQFIQDVCWGKLDYLVIDTPPGTSDEHLTIVDTLSSQVTGAILVTTPQAVAVGDVRRELTFCRKAGFPVVGVIENMSGYICPHCSECSLLFSRGGGEDLAKQEDVPFLGRVPIDPALNKRLDAGEPFSNIYSDSNTSSCFDDIVSKVISGVSMA